MLARVPLKDKLRQTNHFGLFEQNLVPIGQHPLGVVGSPPPAGAQGNKTEAAKLLTGSSLKSCWLFVVGSP